MKTFVVVSLLLLTSFAHLAWASGGVTVMHALGVACTIYAAMSAVATSVVLGFGYLAAKKRPACGEESTTVERRI